MTKADFHIVNGDLTEFGREITYDDYKGVYHNDNVLTLEGLGDNDYDNNVGDCVATDDLSYDGYAISAVIRMSYLMRADYSRKSLPYYSTHETWREVKGFSFNTYYFEGSYAYSWDYGDVHYVQLQNYPSYTTKLSSPRGSAVYVNITKSLDWLEIDFSAAARRGKIIINYT